MHLKLKQTKKKFEASKFFPLNLHIGSCHATKFLLEDGKHIPHRGGESLRIQEAHRAATLQENRWENIKSFKYLVQ